MRTPRCLVILAAFAPCSVGGVGLTLGPTAADDGPIFPDDYGGDGILDELDECIAVWNGLPDAPGQLAGRSR